ncbi:MAG: L-threonylcarbamoyladenylate synthase [Pseudomonadota bacterium]
MRPAGVPFGAPVTAAHALAAGGVVAYPTEAVFGLGCDPDNPDAVARLLALKRRPWRKGLILLAADLDQLRPYLAPLTPELEARLMASWPGPHTWLVPAARGLSRWLRGEHPTLAVRVSAHPPAAALARAFGKPVISTSANRAGRPPLDTADAVRRTFGARLDHVLSGPTGGQARPTAIRDLVSGEVVRAG